VAYIGRFPDNTRKSNTTNEGPTNDPNHESDYSDLYCGLSNDGFPIKFLLRLERLSLFCCAIYFHMPGHTTRLIARVVMPLLSASSCYFLLGLLLNRQEISKLLAKLDAVHLLHAFSHIGRNAMRRARITAPHTLAA
jgi:hypothetical protein